MVRESFVLSNASSLAAASSLRAGLRAALAQIEACPVERAWRPAFLTPLSALPLPRRTPLADLPGERPPAAPFGGQPLTIAAALYGLRTRRLAVADLLPRALAAIDARQDASAFGGYLAPAVELRAEVEALDAELRAGVCRGSLHGIPLLVQDVIDVAGMPGRGDSLALGNRITTADAGSTRLIRAAGAVIAGQTRLHAAERNDATAVTAAGEGLGALALDACVALLGAAASRGVVGYKPTFGLIPNDGAHLRSWSFDQVGCLAATVEDAALLLDVLDPAPHVRYSEGLFKAMRGVRVGVPLAALEGAETGFAAAFREAVAAMRQAGAEVAEIETPGADDFDLAQAAALVVSRAESAAYHTIYGRRRVNGGAPAAAEPDEEAGRVSAAHYLQAQRIREDLRWRLLRTFDRFDALLLPTLRTGASRRGETDQCGLRLGQNTVLWSLLGFPAVSLPCGWTPQRRPIGAAVVAAPYEDARLLAIAAALELELSRG